MNPISKSDDAKFLALQRKIQDLETQIADLHSRFPAHSLKPAMLVELDELDEALNFARLELLRLSEQEDR